MDERGCVGLSIVKDIAVQGGAEHGSLRHVPMIEQEVADICRSDIRIVLQMRMECRSPSLEMGMNER